jgi:hypothetical protein
MNILILNADSVNKICFVKFATRSSLRKLIKCKIKQAIKLNKKYFDCLRYKFSVDYLLNNDWKILTVENWFEENYNLNIKLSKQLHVKNSLKPNIIETVKYSNNSEDAKRIRLNLPLNTKCHSGKDGDCNWEKCPQKTEYLQFCPLYPEYEEY